MMNKTVLTFLFSILITSPLFAAELTVFSSRKEPLIKPVLNLFTEKTGIEVNLKTGKSPALVKQILEERDEPTADIFISKSAGSLEYLRLENLLSTYKAKDSDKIRPNLKSINNTWYGVSGRTRAIIYNKNMINVEDVPRTIEELINPKYKGKIASVNSNNEYLTAWVSALRLNKGDEWTKTFLSKLLSNDLQILTHSHTDVRKAVGRGEHPLGLLNHYYIFLQKNELDDKVNNVGIVYLNQGEGEMGEFINTSGVGIIQNAPHLTEAQQFVDFLLSEEAQKLFAELNYEYPTRYGVQTHPQVLESLNCDGKDGLKCLNQMQVSLTDLGPLLDTTIEMLEEANWY